MRSEKESNAKKVVDGPRVRGSKVLVGLLNNVCFSMRKSPNAGTPEVIRLGLLAYRDKKPLDFEWAVRSIARDIGLSEADVIAITEEE